jgi:hypothetical protein
MPLFFEVGPFALELYEVDQMTSKWNWKQQDHFISRVRNFNEKITHRTYDDEASAAGG